ncbi:MAG: Ribosomal protein L11 methyltransferase [Syntrophorhabdaceae bacterium PtaU1.Bin034]|nr:MAG: Ribosomal protein L11 methyltransferase [Syntrophorhabdaceae bacterium PtaU1.Bin034]
MNRAARVGSSVLVAVLVIGLVVVCRTPFFTGAPLVHGAGLQRIVLYDVPYVPTHENTIEEMLRICEVSPHDIVYDLGCGDGRIVITAAKKFGARGVGIDIDPVRIAESRTNAAREGVEDKVRFVQQDLFQADFRQATVVTIYLLSGINLKLRPMLFEQLRPGTRLASHDFSMGEWEPDGVRHLGSDTIYYWIVPANASGTWKWKDPKSGQEWVLRITQQFQAVKGSITQGRMRLPISEARLSGDVLSFKVERPGKDDLYFQAKVSGHNLAGTINTGEGKGQAEVAWAATRDPATVVPLESTQEREENKNKRI